MLDIIAALRSLILPYGQPANSPQIVINEVPVRAAIQTLYSNKVIADFVFQQNSQTYVYMALVTPTVGLPFLAFGAIESVGLVISEAFRVVPGTIGSVAQLLVTGRINFTTLINSAADIQVEGVPQGRGWLDGVMSNAGAAATIAEQVSLTSNTIKFRNGRAFAAEVNSQVLASAANSAAFVGVRRNNVAGTILHFAGANAPITTVAERYSHRAVFINNSGADITDNLVQTLTRAAGAGTVQDFGTATQLRLLDIYDIGPASRYASAPQL